MRKFDLGIVGGGQLARMTVERAAKLGFRSMVLDPAEDCPAAEVAAGFLRAGFDDRDALRELADRCRVTTLDLEAPDARALADLERRGHAIRPTPATLAVLQDKWRQRRYFEALGFPVPRFFESSEPTPADAERLGFPCVQKARRGGYDGRGVVVIRGRDDVAGLLPVPSVFEEFVPIEREISVLVARGLDGDTRCYPAVETIFDPRLNLIEGALFPARLGAATSERARRLALGAVEALGGVGIFAVELFAGPRGALWLNEIAPRPHNSGHLTIEASRTCQFEQHVRAVLGLPLGDPGTVSPAAMVNLTGPEGGEGPVHLPGLPAALAVPGARLHLYGKSRVRPGRKMGHVTVLDPSQEAALERAREARARLALRASVVNRKSCSVLGEIVASPARRSFEGIPGVFGERATTPAT